MSDKIVETNKLPETEERGATMVEYGIMVVLIVVVVIVAVRTLGQNISTAFSQTASAS